MPDPYPKFAMHYRVLSAAMERLNRAAWEATAKKGRTLRQRQKLYRPSEEANEIVQALNARDVPRIKALFLHYL